jgi:hypothetical protein
MPCSRKLKKMTVESEEWLQQQHVQTMQLGDQFVGNFVIQHHTNHVSFDPLPNTIQKQALSTSWKPAMLGLGIDEFLHDTRSLPLIHTGWRML